MLFLGGILHPLQLTNILVPKFGFTGDKFLHHCFAGL